MAKMTQDELDRRIGMHVVWQRWMWDQKGPPGERLDLSGEDLSGMDLSGLADPELTEAVAGGPVILTGALLAGTSLLAGVPVVPGLDAAILAEVEAGRGRLNMRSWHGEDGRSGCGTTHCRAGWAVHLAGPVGCALEAALGTAVAGALIYAASSPGGRVPDFFAEDDEALADIRARAAAA